MRRWLLTPLVASLFGVSFWESWSALTDAANDAEIPHPGPWPHAVDGFILACALLVVEARRTGHQRGAWWPRLGLLGATALSTSIQGIYAPEQAWAWALHAWSPLAVLFSFECGVWLFFAPVADRPKAERASGPPLPARAHAWLRSWDLPERATSQPSLARVTELPTGRVERLDSKRPNSPTLVRRSGPISGRDRAKVAAWRAETPPRSARWIAGQLGLKGGQGREQVARLIEELRAAPVGGPSDNGGGP